MPAPAARMRSERVPWGLSSTSISPARSIFSKSLVLPDVARDHLPDLPPHHQDRDPEIVGARVVADHGQVPGAPVLERRQEVLGDAAEAEARDHDGGAVGDVEDRGGGVLDDLVHLLGSPCGDAPFPWAKTAPHCACTPSRARPGAGPGRRSSSGPVPGRANSRRPRRPFPGSGTSCDTSPPPGGSRFRRGCGPGT